jgi:hypothetical protein
LAEEDEPLGADECIAITLNPQEFLWPEGVPIDDREMLRRHLYFVVLTWEQWLATEELANARANHKWWGYRERKAIQERSGIDFKTKRRIQDDQKIHVKTWNVRGKLYRRKRYMVDSVTYERITRNPLPTPHIVILQWMKCGEKLATDPEPPRPRGMDDRGPLPRAPLPGPQGEGNPGGNNDQQHQQQHQQQHHQQQHQQQQLELELLTGALTFDGLMGTDDMSFVKVCSLDPSFFLALVLFCLPSFFGFQNCT